MQAAAPPPPTRLSTCPPPFISGQSRNSRLRFTVQCRRRLDCSDEFHPSSVSQLDLFLINFVSKESFPARLVLNGFPSGAHPRKSVFTCVKCEKNDKSPKYVTVERPPYSVYMDSTSGQLEPASGARASIPGPEYWPEGTADRVRAARAPDPKGVSTTEPSLGKRPGSRRKGYKASALAAHTTNQSGAVEELIETETSSDILEEPLESSSEYVVYQTESEEKNLTDFELDKKLGRPHPYFDPQKKRPVGEPLTGEEIWWNWRKPEEGHWTRWRKRRPDVETVFLKAMAETGQVKLYGEHPTIAEATLYRTRRHLYKEERLKAEQERLKEIGPLAYYSEWVKAWKKDTSREAVQKRFEETGEEENIQLHEMFSYQTDREYRIMIGTDTRLKRDPLAMRMREDQIKQIWGGDPVYPTINYIQDPNEVTDFRGPEFHEPAPSMIDYLLEHGHLIPREEIERFLAKEKKVELESTDIDDAMARAVDIGETDDGEDSDTEVEDEAEEKLTRNWSVLKTSPQLRKSKEKPKMADSMSLDEAMDDSENLTDFLMDFDEDEQD